MSTVTDYAIEFESISKLYLPSNWALRNINFKVKHGCIHAICGENGAGKSTLMKILFGLQKASSGKIFLNGTLFKVRSVTAARAAGIGMVHQHFSLVNSLSVAENIVLGHEPRHMGIFFNKKMARNFVSKLAKRYNLSVNTDALIDNLSIEAQQKVELLKSLAGKIRILILDEPTAVLTPLETKAFFHQLRQLRNSGLTILFISHKIQEIQALAQRITVLRNGQISLDTDIKSLNNTELATAIFGKQCLQKKTRYKKQITKTSPPLIEMDKVCYDASKTDYKLYDINLQIAHGEILGIAGIEGSGQSGLAALLSGTQRPQNGDIRFAGKSVINLSTMQRRLWGMAHIPSDRFARGGAAMLSLMDNLTAGILDKSIKKGGFWHFGAMMQYARNCAEQYQVRYHRITQPLSSLSGGNVQKLVTARELSGRLKFLIAEQPTRGLDGVTTNFLHEKLFALADSGIGILLISADIDQILSVCDRIAILFKGHIIKTVVNHHLSRNDLGQFMLGTESIT